MNTNTNFNNCKKPAPNTKVCAKNTPFDMGIPNYITESGYLPYYRLTHAVRKPKVEHFNSFAICVPAKISLVIKIKGLEDIRLPNKELAYTMSFGVFDSLVSDVTIESDNLKGVYLAFSRTSGSTPITLPIEICKVCSTSDYTDSENVSEDKRHIVKFRKDTLSKLEDGVLLIEVVNNVLIKTLFDDNNEIIENYIIETNC